MTSMLMDDHGNALDAFDSLREGIKALRNMCLTDIAARDECVLLVFDKDGSPIEAISWEDLRLEGE